MIKKWNKKNTHDFYVPNLWTFLKSNRIFMAVTLIFLFVTYFVRMTFYSTTLDQEAIMNDDIAHLYDSWFVLGRFGLVYLYKILGMMSFDPFLASSFLVIFIFIGCLAWSYLFYTLNGDIEQNKPIYWTFSIIFITAPILAEMYNFMLLSFFVSLSFILLAIAFLLINKWIMQNTIIDGILGMILATLCFSIYQANVPMFITAAAFSFISIYKRYSEKKEDAPNNKFYLTVGLKYIFVFVFSYIIYTVLNKIISELHGGLNQYIKDQVLWGKIPFKECIKNILKHLYDISTGRGIFYNLLYAIVVISFILLIINELRKKKTGRWFYTIAVIIFLIAPFYLTIYSASIPVYRSQMALPLMLAMSVYFIILNIPKFYNKLKVFAIVVVVAFAFSQTKVTSRLFYTEYVRFNEDVSVCNKISSDINDLGLGECPNQPVVFVGGRSCKLNKSCIRGEAIGLSIFEINSIVGGRGLMFMETIGINYNMPNKEQLSKSKSLSDDMPIWPAKGSVALKDDIIIVKLL